MPDEKPLAKTVWDYLQAARVSQDADAYDTALGAILSSSSAVLKQTSDTDASLTDTIHSLSTRLDRMEISIGSVTGSAQALADQFGSQISDRIEEHIAPVRNELASIKDEVLPKLDTAQRTVKSVEEFLRSNAAFLATAIEAQGLLRGLQGETASIAKRLDALESIVNKAWDRRLTILSLVVAVLSAVVAAYALLSR
jgi:chromosome segregation ATPase